ncbi:MAG: ImpA family type VI secretion system protein [Maritimibacter sp.]
MDIDALLEPVSEDAPCGPDLNADMDPEYDEYYFDSAGRLPGFYYQPGVDRPDGSRSPDRVFDPTEVDLAAEQAATDSLLTRCRDLRLLVLRAQWEALAGKLGSLSQTIEATAALLETFPDDVQPTLADGVSERRDALSDLANQVTMMQALQFAPLVGSAEVTLRKLRVSNGNGTPLAGEEDMSHAMLTDALGDSAYRTKVDETHAALLVIKSGLERISRACQTNATAPFSPQLDPVLGVVTEMLDAITNARPDLRGADVDSVVELEGAVDASASNDGDSPAPAAAAAATAPAGDVVSQAHARMILEACEHYFRRCEPSSAALLLVTQARLLIGRPLIEALETLLPQESGRAIVDFGPQTGFALNIERLRMLSGAMPEGASPDTPQTDQGQVPDIINNADAAQGIRSVEDYFRRVERSSPVPVLLQRARSYLDKDFQSLVAELIPSSENAN